MARTAPYLRLYRQKLKTWLNEGRPKVGESYYQPKPQIHQTHAWWRVMCLTGVDYFSTLGYQPGIAALAAGALSPIATLIVVLVTLFGALPMYRRVAGESPHGNGSISMLAELLEGWPGKLMVLALLGFIATDFVITITLSAADATAHIVENPFVPKWLVDQPLAITLFLVALLGFIFLKGFREAIGIAVLLVLVYLVLNTIVIINGFFQVLHQPQVLVDWKGLLSAGYSNPMAMLGAALLVFPKLALGLSGFETGVAVMPQVKGDPGDTPEHPEGRIRNTRKLLTAAALIMSVLLITSALVTTWLIPAAAFQPGGEANGRALAYLAHKYLGEWFGTLYDLSTILILWFAGASAMAGLLNIVPRYLPRYGMAPDWTKAFRPLTLVFTGIGFLVTVLFKANVDAQAGAYATGVLVIMTSAAIAVSISAYRKRQRPALVAFILIGLVLLYTLIANIIERPEGLQIALVFIASILAVSFVSRISRSTELRVDRIELDQEATEYLKAITGEIRLIAHHRETGKAQEYRDKADRVRKYTHLPDKEPVLFLEVGVVDASDFTEVLRVHGVNVGEHSILRTQASSVPNAIAALSLFLRDQTGKVPHIYFQWGEGSPLQLALRFVLFGEGDIPTITHEIVRKAEPRFDLRPIVHVG